MARTKLEPTIVVRIPQGMKVLVERMKVFYKRKQAQKETQVDDKDIVAV